MRAKRRVLKTSDRAVKMAWQDIAATLPHEDRFITDGPASRLWRPNVLVYLDVREDFAVGTGGIVSHRLLALAARMRFHGAVVSPALVPGVTHVVVDFPRIAGARLQVRPCLALCLGAYLAAYSRHPIQPIST